MRHICFAIALMIPTTALAVGTEDPAPPTPTQTTQDCTDGKVWDADASACVAPKESSLDDDGLYRAAREFAYDRQYGAALDVLAAMSDPQDDRVLTYLGFVNRKLGHTEDAMRYYHQALVRNPGNLLARSYLGQALVAAGDLSGARAQLSEIRARDGRNSWPETALRLALETGHLTSY